MTSKKLKVLGLVLPIKNPEKSSEFWQNYPDFSKNSEEKSAEILSLSSTKKIVRKIF
jgi:hypothetical protein